MARELDGFLADTAARGHPREPGREGGLVAPALGLESAEGEGGYAKEMSERAQEGRGILSIEGAYRTALGAGRRREIVARYDAGFEPLDAFDLPTERPGCRNAWHLYPLRLREGALTISRDEFIEELRRRNIGTSVHFIAIHTFTYYRKKYGFQPEDFPVANRESNRVVTIPLHPGLSDRDVDDVIEAVADIVAGYRA